MKRQQAFTGTERLLKGCLHCHTTRTDGKVTPEETVRIYYQNGYDFMAITDHRKFNYIHYAPELPITIIPGMEFDNTFEHGKGFRTYHTLCLGYPKEESLGYKQDVLMDSGTAQSQEEYQVYLDEMHDKGYMTIHCHPQWSSTSLKYFEKLKGNIAMEIWNSGNAIMYDMDRDALYWDEILGQGQVIYGVATDDSHWAPHHCKGWVRVKAENTVSAILAALKNGEFYSSCGPDIYDFYIKDGVAVVECSPAERVRFQCDMHPNKVVRAEEGLITHAEFQVDKDWDDGYKYLRATVIDQNGKFAWTNPIFV